MKMNEEDHLRGSPFHPCRHWIPSLLWVRQHLAVLQVQFHREYPEILGVPVNLVHLEGLLMLDKCIWIWQRSLYKPMRNTLLC